MNKVQDKRSWIIINKNTETYRKIQYSLKLSLRMLNGRFENFNIQQINTTTLNFDQKFKDKVTLDCWYKTDDQEEIDYMQSTGQINISPTRPKLFTSGTVIEKADDLQENVLYTFYLFKVVVSVYLEGESPSNLFQHKYLIYSKDCTLLTYAVNFKIRIEPLASITDVRTCVICGNQAIKYCLNDEAYYCEDCDIATHENHQKDSQVKVMSKHTRVPISDRPLDFESCSEHPTKKNEYYCYCCQQVYCSDCMINSKSNEGSALTQTTAYNNALNDAKHADVGLDEKKKLIIEQIGNIQEKIKQIKVNAESIQQQITRILEETINSLMQVVQQKSAILKSDRLELSRQFREIDFMTEFLKRQAEETTPLEFLQLFAGHKQLKDQIYKQRTTVSDIQIDMKLNGKPIIISDSSFKSVDIQHVNIDNKNNLDKAKSSIEQLHLFQRSTNFRTQLFGKARNIPGQKDTGLFNSQNGLQEVQNKIPTKMKAFESEMEIQGALRQGITDNRQRQKADVTNKIEKALRAIEERLEVPDYNIVDESVKRSIFGIFTRNFKQFKETQAGDLDVILRKYFKNSNILDDVSRVILYFNLPYNPIIKERIEPVKIFPPQTKSNQDSHSIQAMIEAFEDKQNVVRQANIILMRVESEDKDGNQNEDDGKDTGYIVGGYASHGWSASFDKRGDDTCFLFNLTQNLRFNAIKGQQYYQTTDAREQSTRRIKFGDTDLVIQDDFQHVYSQMKNTHFAFGNQLFQKNKIDSIIPGKPNFRPSVVEVWSFSLRHQA
eukprot:403352607